MSNTKLQEMALMFLTAGLTKKTQFSVERHLETPIKELPSRGLEFHNTEVESGT